MIELFPCQALKARISRRQCRINQDEAERRSNPAGQRQCWNGRGGYIGPLHFCLECTQPEALEAKRLEAPEPRQRTTNRTEKINLDGRDKAKPTKISKEKINMPAIIPNRPENSNMDETPAKEVKYCRNHPDRPVFERKNGTQLKTCEECLKASMKAKWSQRLQKRNGGEALLSPIGPESGLLLDFTGREELLRNIVEVAAEEERTPAGQVLYWLKKHLREGRDA